MCGHLVALGAKARRMTIDSCIIGAYFAEQIWLAETCKVGRYKSIHRPESKRIIKSATCDQKKELKNSKGKQTHLGLS